MSLTILASFDKNGVLHRPNEMAWHIPRLDRLVNRHSQFIIMGRHTFEKIGLVPGHLSAVLTHDDKYFAKGGFSIYSIKEGIDMASRTSHWGPNAEVVAIGGFHVYRKSLNLAKKMELYYLDVEYLDGEHFPEVDRDKWVQSDQERFVEDGIAITKALYHLKCDYHWGAGR